MMLSNLKAEYVRKGITPYKRVMNVLGCSEKTARNKLSEKCPTTVPEALKLKEKDFKDEQFSIEYLFATDASQRTAF